MINVLGHSFSPAGLILSVLILVFLITQAIWWIGRIFGKFWYFPSHSICMSVHKNIKKWFKKTTEVLTLLVTPNVNGFICAVLLLGIISLNVTLLAQIWELFLPPGERLTFPLIGTYATFPLIAGLLYALVQVAFSTVWKRKERSGERTLGITMLLILSITVEAGLNFYRAWLLTSGGQQISPTLWDQVIMFGGPILAGFLGLLVPTAEIVLSPYAILEFIEPVIKDAVIIVRFLASTIFLTLTWIFFGFHNPKPVIIPVAVKRVKLEVEKLQKEESRLTRKVEELKQLVRDLKSSPIGAMQLEAQVADLKSKVGLLESEVLDKIEKFDEYILDIDDKRSLNIAKLDIKEWIESIRVKIEPINSHTQDISDAAGRFKQNYDTLQNETNKYLDAVINVKSDTEAIKQQLNSDCSLRRLLTDIKLVLMGNDNPSGELSKAEIEDLREIIIPIDDTYENEWNRLVLSKIREILDFASVECERINNTLNNYSRTLNNLQGQIEKKLNENGILDQTELEEMQKCLVDMDNNVMGNREKIRNRIKIWRGDMSSKAWKLRAVILFVTLMVLWRPRI
jgi:hypothetical protein